VCASCDFGFGVHLDWFFAMGQTLATFSWAIGIGAGLAAVALTLLIVQGRLNRRLKRASADARTAAAQREALATAVERERADREAVLGALEDGILLFDETGEVLFANDRARELLGARLQRARDLAPSSLRAIVETALAGGTDDPVEVEGGVAGRLLRGSAARIAGQERVLLVLQDVTESRMADSIRRDFAANASHELKTPAASIRALAETIAAGAENDPASLPRFVAQLEVEAVRLSRIVSDLLDLSRLETEPAARTELRLDRLVAEEAGRLKDRAEDAGLSFAIDTDGRVAVRGSPRDLALLVRNLIENAIQYTRPGGRVEVSVSREDGSAVFAVRDSGIGIPSRDQARIFERFYRVDRARSRDTGGTGLGLSIVKHVAANHGGTVNVDSHLGRGSTFTVRLPLAGAGSSAGAC
jgi:two-component system sensor histidine kinase SenX3